jgi:hypothetical protein
LSDDPQILVFGRGRPPLSRAEPSAAVNVRLPESDYDIAYKMASAQRVSVPEILRRAFKQFIQDERGGVLRHQK